MSKEINNDTWLEFVIRVDGIIPGHKIPMCGLCGGTGIIDTSGRVPLSPAKVPVGPIRKPCICPNGRCHVAT